MLKLRGKVQTRNISFDAHRLLTVTSNTNIPSVLRDRYALLTIRQSNSNLQFGAHLVFEQNDSVKCNNVFILNSDFEYLSDGDVIRLESDGRVSCLFRRNSRYNTFLLTEQCNHYCLMCSQPPKNRDDSWLLSQTMDILEVIPKGTGWIGFSGGEPTLYGDDFIKLLSKAKSYLPYTGIDVLTNGRAFNNQEFADKVANVNHPNCTFGIPLYSDDPLTHDYVVQSSGAFDETIQGILNLKSKNQKVEIRIVIHKQTVERLVKTCEFIARNLIFVDHVALMGLEITGFTRANLDNLWIDPIEYKDELSKATKVLNTYGISASIYNHQLCILNDDVLMNYQKSISDWKNEYVTECEGCTRKNECGGFFSSSKQYKYSDHIKPFK